MASHHHNVGHAVDRASVLNKLNADCKEAFDGFKVHAKFSTLIAELQQHAAAPRRATHQTEEQHKAADNTWRFHQATRLIAAENQFMHAVLHIQYSRVHHPWLAHMMDFKEIIEGLMVLKYHELRPFLIRAYAEEWPMAIENGRQVQYHGWKIPNMPEADARPAWTELCEWQAVTTQVFVQKMDDNWLLKRQGWLLI